MRGSVCIPLWGTISFSQDQGNSNQGRFHRIPVSIISTTWKGTFQTVRKKHADPHKHEITWCDLVLLALTVVESNMRKVQASMVDLNSGKPRYGEFSRLERQEHEK